MIVVKFDITFQQFIEQLDTNEQLRNDIIMKVKNCYDDGMKNVVLEFPPYTNYTKDALAEFSIIECSNFASSDSSEFDNHFNKTNDNSVVIFKNLNGDTILIFPEPNDKKQYSGDVMSFMINGNNEQKHNLLKTIGIEMTKQIKNNDRVYLSTSGHAIPWLHIRLAKQPKYYVSKKYREM
mgnify:CR=1 FL=1